MPPDPQLTWRLCRGFALAFAAVTATLALLRPLSLGWFDGAALAGLTRGELALVALYPLLCVLVAAAELRRHPEVHPEVRPERPVWPGAARAGDGGRPRAPTPAGRDGASR